MQKDILNERTLLIIGEIQKMLDLYGDEPPIIRAHRDGRYRHGVNYALHNYAGLNWCFNMINKLLEDENYKNEFIARYPLPLYYEKHIVTADSTETYRLKYKDNVEAAYSDLKAFILSVNKKYIQIHETLRKIDIDYIMQFFEWGLNFLEVLSAAEGGYDPRENLCYFDCVHSVSENQQTIHLYEKATALIACSYDGRLKAVTEFADKHCNGIAIIGIARNDTEVFNLLENKYPDVLIMFEDRGNTFYSSFLELAKNSNIKIMYFESQASLVQHLAIRPGVHILSKTEDLPEIFRSIVKFA